MKNFIFIFILLISTTCTAQVLTPKAKKLKELKPKQFHAIETFAFREWQLNEAGRIQEINEQIAAYLEVCKIVLKDLRLHKTCLKAIKVNSEDSKRKDPFLNPSVNWKKVLFDLKSRTNPKLTH